MIPLKKSVTSSVGKKYLMAISGLALVLFVITHLIGNLALYFPTPDAFNAYTEKLASFGSLLIVAEIGLVGMFVLHIITAIAVSAENKKARPQAYHKRAVSKGGESKSNASSRNMIITGLVLLVFLVVHIWQFKFGPNVSQGYTAQLDGKEVRDLHRLVVETFQDPMWVGFYVFVMLLLGFHLRHGFWSAFQSLGALNPRWSKPIYATGIFLAVLLALGFLGIPLWLYFKGGV